MRIVQCDRTTHNGFAGTRALDKVWKTRRRLGAAVSWHREKGGVGGAGGVGQRGCVKTYVGTLRAKIEQDPQRPVYIVARRGVGYYFDPRTSGGMGAADRSAAGTARTVQDAGSVEGTRPNS